MRASPLLTRRVALAGFAAVSVVLASLALLALGPADGAGPPARDEGVAARGGGQAFAEVPDASSSESSVPPSAVAPDDRSLRLTVPALERARDVPVADAGPDDNSALRAGAIHVRGTGFPWQRGANTYIAGHRLGFPGTRSHLLFWDLDKLEKGDRVLLEDASGRLYEYAVFRKAVVGPDAVRVTAPVPGKSVVSLQTCTLPDYADRLIVQAELVGEGP